MCAGNKFQSWHTGPRNRDRLDRAPYIITPFTSFERAANARICFMGVRPNRSIWSRQYSNCKFDRRIEDDWAAHMRRADINHNWTESIWLKFRNLSVMLLP